MGGIEVAWAVITRNAPESLRETLLSLTGCVGNQRVLVSDDSDGWLQAATGDVCRELGVVHTVGPQQGPVGNRRHALRACMDRWQPSHVVFLDDDIQMNPSTCELLLATAASHPRDILCVRVRDDWNGPVWMPSQVNWKGVRNVIAPPVGGTALSDNCMLWPVEAAVAVEWDTTFVYGYAEAWLGEQAAARGYTIRILDNVPLVHRTPGRGVQRTAADQMEAARVFYNFRIKELRRGRAVAWLTLVLDALLTNGKRLVLRRPCLLRPYLEACRRVRLRASGG